MHSYVLITQQNEALETDIIEYGYNYTGELKDGKRNGKGKYTYQNGDVYEGMWSDDVKDGYGKLIFENDSKTYVGDFISGVFEGWGTLHILGGEKYEGEWKNGKKSGEGTYYYPFGNIYTGEWKDDKRNGKGTYIYPFGKNM